MRVKLGVDMSMCAWEATGPQLLGLRAGLLLEAALMLGGAAPEDVVCNHFGSKLGAKATAGEGRNCIAED